MPVSIVLSFPQKEESSDFSHKMEGAGKMGGRVGGGVGGLSYKRVIITYFQTNPSWRCLCLCVVCLLLIFRVFVSVLFVS